MYPRQFKQFLKNAQPDFDERKYGSINDLMRAAQKDGLLRLERDRQGGLRVFAGGSPRAAVPHGWGLERGNGGNGSQVADEPVAVIAEPVVEPVIEAQVTTLSEEPVAEKPKRTRKTAGEKKKAAPRKKKTAAAL
jgi:hypothetical protein